MYDGCVPTMPAPTSLAEPAPCGRAGGSDLAAQQQAATDPVFSTCLEAMPCAALALNRQRQVVAANRRLLEMLGLTPHQAAGRRPGELVRCVHAGEGPDGCGTAEACRHCGAAATILDCRRMERQTRGECRITLAAAAGGGALDLELTATPILLGGQDLAVIALQDIADSKRREVLERLFLHDVLNTARGLRGLSEIIVSGNGGRGDDLALLNRLATHLIDEIEAHRELAAAERGDLAVKPRQLLAGEILGEVRDCVQRHQRSRGRQLEVLVADGTTLRSDPLLLRRALVNLAINAIEATPAGGRITLSAGGEEGRVVFRVANPGCVPPEVAARVFQRSFTTKGDGRGLGCYGTRLLAERYLRGRVRFASDPASGTVAEIVLPAGL
jgi:signal transduction histidine kinase